MNLKQKEPVKPYVYQAYPKMLYKAEVKEVIQFKDEVGHHWKIVKDEVEHDLAKKEGWSHVHPKSEAIPEKEDVKVEKVEVKEEVSLWGPKKASKKEKSE